MGGTHIIESDHGKVKMVTLDEYIDLMNIDAQMVKFIWMDIEGFEAKALIGAAKLLGSHRIPLFQEFNPIEYEKQETMRDYCEIVQEHYTNMHVFFPQNKGGIMEMGVSDIFIVREEMKKFNLEQIDILYY